MSIALFALAAVMIVGGIVSVIQGFPFVRLESGLAMTIAGATTASAGAIVLGLAVVARHLRGLEGALAGAPRAAFDPSPIEPEQAASARQRPSLAATAAGLGALGGAGLGAAATLRTGREPTFFDPAPPPPAPEIAATPNPAEPLLPNLLPEGEAPATPARPPEEAMLFGAPEARPGQPPLFVEAQPEPASHGHAEFRHEPDFAQPEAPRHEGAQETAYEPAQAPIQEPAPEPAPEPVPHVAPEPPHAASPEPEPVVLRPALIEAVDVAEPAAPAPPVAEAPPPEPQALPEPQAPSEPEAPPEPQVVGTYASGGNTYVMYSTGVIEAETPRGRYTFASLDELKAFVEAGGEADARGAA